MQANYANALCHLNATPLSAAVLAPCAWGENLACGVAWQSVANSATHNTAWRGEFENETAKRNATNSTMQTIQSIILWAKKRTTQQSKRANLVWQVFAGKTTHGDTANSAWQVWRIQQSENGAVFGRGTSLSLSLSLVSQLFICDLFFKIFKSFYSFFFAFKVKIHKFYSFLWLARNDGSFCHFEPFAKRRKIYIRCSALRVLCGYFAVAQYDKFRLSLKFFKTNEKFKKFKEFSNFLKNFIRSAKMTLCVAGLCYNELV